MNKVPVRLMSGDCRSFSRPAWTQDSLTAFNNKVVLGGKSHYGHYQLTLLDYYVKSKGLQ